MLFLFEGGESGNAHIYMKKWYSMLDHTQNKSTIMPITGDPEDKFGAIFFHNERFSGTLKGYAAADRCIHFEKGSPRDLHLHVVPMNLSGQNRCWAIAGSGCSGCSG